MIVKARICDVCQTEVDPHWPLELGAGRENSPTGEHLSVDFCSVACLRRFLTSTEWQA